MRILVTAGNTLTPIDAVRCITNVFTGRTGARLAWEACARGHQVQLLTSHPEIVDELRQETRAGQAEALHVQAYRTFADLERLMEEQVRGQRHDAIIHGAAVSDYEVAGVFVPEPDTRFDPAANVWRGGTEGPRLRDARQGKVGSRHEELWMRLRPTPKLVDRIRSPWAFRGVLVKFKLEVGVADAELLDIAERSRRQSAADLMVANTLEGMQRWAYVGPLAAGYEKVTRSALPERLLAAIEQLHEEPRRD